MFSIPVAPMAVPQKNLILQPFEQHFLAHKNKIEQWFEQNWQDFPPPFYTSVDLRCAGFKLAPVDTNLFPAGFNNLEAASDPWASYAIKAVLNKSNPNIKRILLVPENHTRNTYYFENVARLMRLLTAAGYAVRLGSLRADFLQAEFITLASSEKIMLEPITRLENRLEVAGFVPELILINNDLSEGIPEILLNVSQAVLPAMHLGWSVRKKSKHFYFYDQIAERFAALLEIDPWLINAYFDAAQNVNFLQHQGGAMLADKASALFAKIKLKYDAYRIDAKPYLIVKADAGTYGMGVISITDPSQLLQLNRKQRTKMAVSKGRQLIDQVILQEGVHSIEQAGVPLMTAESVIYMIGQFVVGGFYRKHAGYAEDGILNAPGMSFEAFPYAGVSGASFDHNSTAISDRFYIYSVIARLALLAAAHETRG